MFRKTIGIVLALGLTAFADAEDVRSPATADTQTIDLGSSDTGTADDSMTDFMASIADVLSENDRSDDLAYDSDNGDDGRNNDPGSSHQSHLGLGFAYGMGNANGNPHNDECRGNGHPGNPDGNGGGNGNGHDDYQGNGFGHRDCGEPSPSD